jgi:hypothetical protein
LLALSLFFFGARYFTRLLINSVDANAPWFYLLMAFGLTTLATTMTWLEHQAELGEITKSQRKIADVIAVTGGVVGLAGVTLYPSLIGEIISISVVFAVCAVALALGWLMAQWNQRRKGLRQDLS